MAVLTSVLLVAIALLHAYWALGGCWPASERSGLAATVIGTEGPRLPPAPVTLLVALALAGAGLAPLLWADVMTVAVLPRWLVGVGLWLLIAIFALRGLITYTPLAAFFGEAQPFARLNRQLYSPLCLLIAAALAVVRLT